jgi:hypothetical protein
MAVLVKTINLFAFKLHTVLKNIDYSHLGINNIGAIISKPAKENIPDFKESLAALVRIHPRQGRSSLITVVIFGAVVAIVIFVRHVC